MSVEEVRHITGLVLDLALLAGAVAAAVKYRVFNVFGFRWRTDVVCEHTELADGSVIFLVDYIVNNTGRRPLRLSDVTITVNAARHVGKLIEPDDSKVTVARTVRSGDRALKGIFQIEPGERTIFTLRSRLDHLDEYVFVICTFSTPAQRTPTVFRSFYVKSARRRRADEKDNLPSLGGEHDDEE